MHMDRIRQMKDEFLKGFEDSGVACFPDEEICEMGDDVLSIKTIAEIPTSKFKSIHVQNVLVVPEHESRSHQSRSRLYRSMNPGCTRVCPRCTAA